MAKIETLSMLTPGKKAVIKGISPFLFIRRRLLDIGFIEGMTIECLQKSMLGNPVSYFINQTVIALRLEDADKIFIDKKEE